MSRIGRHTRQKKRKQWKAAEKAERLKFKYGERHIIRFPKGMDRRQG